MAGVRQTTLDFHSLLEEAERNQKVSENLLSQRRIPVKPTLPIRPSNSTYSRSPCPKSRQACRTATQPAVVVRPPTPKNAAPKNVAPKNVAPKNVATKTVATKNVAPKNVAPKNFAANNVAVSRIQHRPKNVLASNNGALKSAAPPKNAVSNSVASKIPASNSVKLGAPKIRTSPSQEPVKRVDKPPTSYSDLMLLARTNISEPPGKDPGKQCPKPAEKAVNSVKACRQEVVRSPKPVPQKKVIPVSKSLPAKKNPVNRVAQPAKPTVNRVVAHPIKPPTVNRAVAPPVKPTVNRVTPRCPPPKVKPCQLPRRPTKTRPSTYDDEDEDDDDMDDFIVDDDECEEDPTKISATIQSLFKYNRNRRLDCEDDDDCMESSFNDIIKEEKRSARIGMLEDLEDMMREEKERQKRKKKN